MLNRAEILVNALEKRDHTPEEATELEDLKRQIKSLTERIELLEQSSDDNDDNTDSDDPAFDEDRPGNRSVPQPSRGIRSMPPRIDDYGVGSFGINTGKGSRYSFGRAIQRVAENRALDGYEGEVSQECARRDNRTPSAPNSFFMPLRSLSRPFETRDTPSTTTTMAGGVTQQYSDDFLLLLRRASILEKLGVDTIDNVRGNYVIPFETSGCTATWVAENGNVSADAMAVSQLIGIPRALMARYVVSRNMVYSSTYDTQQLMFRDMANSTAEQLSLALVQGQEGATNPVGVLYNVNVNSTTTATSGTIVFEDCLQMQTNVSNHNPPVGDPLKYLVSPFGAQILRSKPRITGTTEFPTFIMSGDSIADVPGSVVSPCVPDNITISGGGSNNTTILYGDFSQVRHIVYGNSIELVVDPFTLAGNNQIALTTFLLNDILIPRPSLLTWATFGS